MAKPKCKCKSAECEECPEWIFTFADLVMLMMGFFVILWVLKPAPGKEGEPPQALAPNVIAPIRIAFGYKPDPRSNDPIDLAAMRILRIPHSPEKGGSNSNEVKGVKGPEPDVETIRKSKQVSTGAKVLFEPGDAKLSDESMRALDEIAVLIKGHTNIFMVKGHTSNDDYPDSNDESQKLALSLLRAQVAADYLITRGVERKTIRVQGCSTFEPVAQRAYTVDVRRLNRRVEVESTGILVKEYEDIPKAKATTPETPENSEPHGEH